MSIQKSGYVEKQARESTSRPLPERELTLRQALPWPVAGPPTKWDWQKGVPDEQPTVDGREQPAQHSVHIEIVIRPARAAGIADLLRALFLTRPGQPGARVLEQAVTLLATHLFDLTPREEEVLEQMMEGKSNRQIALELQIATATVKSHVSNILSKMGAESRTEAVATALRQQARDEGATQ